MCQTHRTTARNACNVTGKGPRPALGHRALRQPAALSLMACLLLGTFAAAEPALNRSKDVAGRARNVELTKCTIKLIDEAILAADRAGVIGAITPREGDLVKDGQVLAALNDEVPRAALAIAEKEAESDVDIRYAEKAGQVSQAEYEKAVEANQTQARVVPEVEVKRLKLAAEKSLLELEAAKLRQAVNQLKRDQAQAELRTYQVRAPFDGFVRRVYRVQGEAVRQGDPVLELVNPRRVRVDGVIDIRDAWRVKPGAEVSVRLDIPDFDLDIEKQSFKGRIVFVDVKAEPVEQNVPVWAEVDNPENILRAGLQARMTIDLGQPPAATPPGG
ncbi:MAG: efflux RND transporter periplasmic adaptor subunit [Planctomycetaceae bacterium]